MATAASLATTPAIPLCGRIGLAERIFWRGVALMAGLILAVHGAGWLERELLHRPGPLCLIQAASKTIAYYLALPHFAIAILFSVTASRNRTPRRQLLILASLLAGVAVCWGYAHLGRWLPSVELLTQKPAYLGDSTFTMTLLIYIYFFIHELRDQAFFYATLGDAPPIRDGRRFAWLVRGLIALTILAVGVVLWVLAVYNAFAKVQGILPSGTSWALRLALAAAPAVLWLLLGYGLLFWYARAKRQRVAEVVRNHAPLLRVLAGEVVVLLVAMALTGRAYALLVLHFTVWYVFVCHKLKTQPRPPSVQGWWTWMRSTPLGFQTLHNGLAGLAITAGLIGVYAFGSPSFVLGQWLIYWTIIHITMSFMPR